MSIYTVKIHYGPCESFNTRSHKPQKLRGLVDRLQKLGFRVDLDPVEFVNYCVLEMCGYEVFRCNIQNLRFNTSYLLDPVCQRAINAVLESSDKFQRARTFLWLWAVLEKQIFMRNKYGPQEYWPGKLVINSFADCLDCKNCCNILASKDRE